MKLEYVLQRKGTNIETVAPDATVHELVAKLAQFQIGALVVSTDGTHVQGIVSERDVVRSIAIHGADILGQPVTTIMTPAVQCAPPSATTADLMALMTDSRIRHVPVIDDDNAMIGIVSIGDVVKSRLGELELERNVLVEYVTIGR